MTLSEQLDSAEADGPLPEGFGRLYCCDITGDTRITWDHNNVVEVENARRTFNDLRAKGHVAYSVKPDGTPDKLVTEFDPTAGKIILTPRLVGG